MTTGTTYAQARTATLNAATDLYGATSNERATVAAAWSAVSVN
jgi:Zn-dependent metalloprotease